MHTLKPIRTKANPDCTSHALPSWLIHDLMQPLSSSGLAIEQLRELLSIALAASDEAFDYLKLVERALQSTESMLASLRRYWHQNGHNTLQLNVSHIPLKEVLARLRTRSLERFPEVTFESPKVDDIYVKSDFSLLSEILWRLIENAGQHARSHIEIALTLLPSELELAVIDNGDGLTPDIVELLGMPFLKCHSSPRVPHHGLGLGIFIATFIADRLGHTLSIDSAKGVGGRFTIRLPIVNNEKLPRGFLPTNSLSSIKILIIELNEKTNISLAHLLSSWGCSVHLNNIQSIEDLKLLIHTPPDLLILNYAIWDEFIGVLGAGNSGQTPCALRLLILTDISDYCSAISSVKESGLIAAVLQTPISPSRLRSALLSVTDMNPKTRKQTGNFPDAD